MCSQIQYPPSALTVSLIDTSRFFVAFTLNLVHQATLRYVRFVEALLCNHSSVHRYPYPPSAPTISPVLISPVSLITAASNLVMRAVCLGLDDLLVTFSSNVVHPLTFWYVLSLVALFCTNLYMYS